MNNPVLYPGQRNQLPKRVNRQILEGDKEKWIWFIIFSVSHIPLALLIYRSTLIATVHALTTLAVGLWWSMSGSRNVPRVVYTAAYIVGAEVLWRMTGATVFWEFGKYSIAILFLITMVRNGWFQGGKWPIFYFMVLLPSAVLIIPTIGWERAREAFSFNLTGPFALMICGWFFSNIKLSTRQLQKLLLFVASPILGIAGIAQYVIQTSESIRFTSNASNFTTSGGYGPNQVSAILGLGALAFFLLLLAGKTRWLIKGFAFAAMLLLVGQSALTFSRGGLYNVVGAIAVAAIYLIRDPATRAKFLPVIIIATLVIYFVVLPKLDDFTGGALSGRLQNTNSTNRSDIAMAQLEVWEKYPVFGVGPGQARYYADQIAHTEVTRLLSEHGVFGLLALLSLLFMGIINIKRARTPTNKALAAAMMTWSFLFMLNAGMRLVAPSFAFGLSFLFLRPEEPAKIPNPAHQHLHKQNNRVDNLAAVLANKRAYKI